jgi:hypothetical protein
MSFSTFTTFFCAALPQRLKETNVSYGYLKSFFSPQIALCPLLLDRGVDF